MKKLLLIIVGIILASTLLYYYQYQSNAQSTPLLLAKITYNTDAEFEKAWNGSTSVHYYYEQQQTKGSYMISRLTQAQFDRLTVQGLKGEIVDQNPDMSKYMIAYSPQAAPLQSFAELGEAEAIDTRFTLVKAGSEQQHEHHDALMVGGVAIFTYDIAKPLVKPKYKTVRAVN